MMRDRRSGLTGRLKDYRVLLLDQRGTGRSSPIGYQSLARFPSPQEQADYLKLFRADNIVRDAEWIRRELKIDRWSVLGQSFGGFCVTTYLSLAPEGLREAFITGGLPPIHHHTDDVYRATYPRVREKNHLYFERYPDDVQRVARHRRLFAESRRAPAVWRSADATAHSAIGHALRHERRL